MEAPRLPSIFKQNEPKRFEFRPRYYNEQKERLDEMRRKYSGESSTGKHSASDFRFRMSSEWRNQKAKGAKGSNIRLVVIVIALFLLTYLILFN